MKLSRIMLAEIFALLMSVPFAAQNASTAQSQPSAGDSKSPSSRIGLFVNPKNNQTPEQQANDEKTCYATAQQQTGIDPSAPSAPPAEAAKTQGGGAKGAARGAAGAAIGGISGDAGTGAAVGATAGAVRGRRQQKKANKQAEQQAAQQSQAQQKQQLDTFRRAFSSCIDATGYSVK